MKQKTHSGTKKRVKVRKSGTIMVQKACKNHLLSNKSKRQKKSFSDGYPLSKSRLQSIRRLMPGKVAGKYIGARDIEVETETSEVAAKATVKKAEPAKEKTAK